MSGNLDTTLIDGRVVGIITKGEPIDDRAVQDNVALYDAELRKDHICDLLAIAMHRNSDVPWEVVQFLKKALEGYYSPAQVNYTPKQVKTLLNMADDHVKQERNKRKSFRYSSW